MSFLDSVLSSIETGKPTPITTSSPAPSPPITSSTTRSEVRRPNLAARPLSSERKSGIATGTKRKAEEPLSRPQKPGSQISAKVPPSTRPIPPKTATPPVSSSPRPISTSKLAKPSTRTSAPTPQKIPPASSKPPPKGSYAELMAKAKSLQQNAPTQVGMFKHQSVPKEKLSKMERRRRLMEVQAKEKDAKQAKKPGASSSVSASIQSGNTKLTNKREHEEPTYKGTARSSQPKYRGTAGLPGRNGDGRGQFRSTKRPRMDEYLGTDEEDEGDFAGDYDDYYSESSDMEAGIDDMEEEEAAALAVAKREDEEEMRAELAAKQEKLERRKKLSMLASRRH